MLSYFVFLKSVDAIRLTKRDVKRYILHVLFLLSLHIWYCFTLQTSFLLLFYFTNKFSVTVLLYQEIFCYKQVFYYCFTLQTSFLIFFSLNWYDLHIVYTFVRLFFNHFFYRRKVFHCEIIFYSRGSPPPSVYQVANSYWTTLRDSNQNLS